MIILFLRYLKGYLNVRFYGELKEQALTLCAKNGISLWGTRLTENGIETTISVNDFRYLRRLKAKKGIRVHILRRKGLPFIAERYKNRLGIFMGALLFFTALSFMSQYIWIIDIDGNKNLTEKEIISACSTIGITEGINKNSFYPKVAREKLMLNLDGIAWASMNIEGSRLTVNITEIKDSNDNENKYSNLKAKCDGIIEKLDIVSGTSVVSVGQAVKKGDLLVSGIIETADGTRYVKSKGEVIAKSQKEIKLYEDFEQVKNIPTGSVKTKKALEVFGVKIPLYLGKEKSDFKATTKTDTLKLFGCNLPIKIYKKTFEYQNKSKVTYGYEKLCERLNKKLLDNEFERVISQEFIVEESGVTLIAIVEKSENIVINDNLIINTGN